MSSGSPATFPPSSLSLVLHHLSNAAPSAVAKKMIQAGSIFFSQCHWYWQPIFQRGSAFNLGDFRDDRQCWRAGRCDHYLIPLAKGESPQAVLHPRTLPLAVKSRGNCIHSSGAGCATSGNDCHECRDTTSLLRKHISFVM